MVTPSAPTREARDVVELRAKLEDARNRGGSVCLSHELAKRILAALSEGTEPVRYYAVERKDIDGDKDIPIAWGRTRAIAEKNLRRQAYTNRRPVDAYRVVPLVSTEERKPTEETGP